MKPRRSVLTYPTFLRLLACLALVLASDNPARAAARGLWVDSAAGNDDNNGANTAPLKTLGRAIALANTVPPGGIVQIKLRAGSYLLSPATSITRDHVQIEGMSQPVRGASGYLEGFINEVQIVPSGPGCPGCALNPLLLVHASDVQFTGLHFAHPGSVDEGYVSDPNSDFMLAIMFEGQWDMANPKALSQEAVRFCHFEGWLIAVNVNFASASIELNREDNCFVPFWFGPAPGGARIDVRHNTMRSNIENGVTATGTPEFWSIPDQPCSLDLDISENIFEGSRLLFGVELLIRDVFPLVGQRGELQATIRKNTFVANHLGAFAITDLSHIGSAACGELDAPVSIHVALDQNSYFKDAAGVGNGTTTTEPWQHTALFAFQQFEPYFNPWLDGCFVNNATIRVDDPANELADLAHCTRKFQYRIRPGDNNYLVVNGLSFTKGLPGIYP